jgi:hypothetical protein
MVPTLDHAKPVKRSHKVDDYAENSVIVREVGRAERNGERPDSTRTDGKPIKRTHDFGDYAGNSAIPGKVGRSAQPGQGSPTASG